MTTPIQAAIEALTVAMEICDAVPTTAHLAPGPLEQAGKLVNLEIKGKTKTGYQIIHDALKNFQAEPALSSRITPDELQDIFYDFYQALTYRERQEAERRMRAHIAAIQAAPAQGSIDTPEFRHLLLAWEAVTHSHPAAALRNLVSHIDAHIAQRAASGDAAHAAYVKLTNSAEPTDSGGAVYTATSEMMHAFDAHFAAPAPLADEVAGDQPCQKCAGTGSVIYDAKCEACKGTGMRPSAPKASACTTNPVVSHISPIVDDKASAPSPFGPQVWSKEAEMRKSWEKASAPARVNLSERNHVGAGLRWAEAMAKEASAPAGQIDNIERRTNDIRLCLANPTSIPRSTLLHYTECLLAHIAVLRAAAAPAGHAEPIYQIANDCKPSGWSDVTKEEFDLHTVTTWREKRTVFAAPVAAEPAPDANGIMRELVDDRRRMIVRGDAEAQKKVEDRMILLLRRQYRGKR